MARLLTYNYLINKYIFNNQICKYNNSLPNKPKSFIFNTTDDVKNFIHYYHFKNHDFGDLSLADEITINDGTYNKTWLIAGFNTQLDSDVKNGTFNKHHLTLIPKNYLFRSARMDDKLLNENGFAHTEMFNIALTEINNNLSNILQNYLLPHKMLLSIDNNETVKSFTVKSMLLNYNQAFGSDLPYQYYYNEEYKICSNKYINGDFDNSDDTEQLPLFKMDVKYRTIGNCCCLRNTYKSTYFTGIECYGYANYSYITDYSIYSVARPFICLGENYKPFLTSIKEKVNEIINIQLFNKQIHF